MPFWTALGDRLAAWVDHHDHERHVDFAHDPRFVLATKAEHGACPEMITPELVRQTGPIDSIVSHVDLDGLYAAAKWILGGDEPYRGADTDARAVDTRMGEPGPIAARIDRALRAESFRDDQLKRAVVQFLVGGMGAGRPRRRDLRGRGGVRPTRRAHARAGEAVHRTWSSRGGRHRRRGRSVRQDRLAARGAAQGSGVRGARLGDADHRSGVRFGMGLRAAVRAGRWDADAGHDSGAAARRRGREDQCRAGTDARSRGPAVDD